MCVSYCCGGTLHWVKIRTKHVKKRVDVKDATKRMQTFDMLLTKQM